MEVKAVSWCSGSTDLHPIPVKFPDIPEYVGAIVWYASLRYEKFTLDQNRDKVHEILITHNEVRNQPNLSDKDKLMIDELENAFSQVAFILPDGRRFVRESLKHDQAFLAAVRSI